MSTYKITNITHLAGKRDLKFNTELGIEFVDNMVKKTVKIKPSNDIFLTVNSLPLSVHRLRVKGLITVSEITKTEMAKNINPKKTTPQPPKKLKPTKPVKIDVVDKTEKKTTKKKVLDKELDK